MAEHETQSDKPGAGVDRTVIRRLLRMTPAERLKLLVVESRNAAEFFTKMRVR